MQLHNRILSIVLAVIVVWLLLLMISISMPAYATGQEMSTIPWFQQYFAEKNYSESESILKPNQKTLLDESIIYYNQSITQNGYTITLLSGISDGCQSFFNFKIVSLDGKVLDGDYSLTY